jgi:transcriptional regulator with XRE-family HTH domain
MELQRVKEVLAILKGRGWTTAALADELGVHRDSVWSWETGRYSPENPKLVMIALERLLQRRRIPKRRRYKRNPPAT